MESNENASNGHTHTPDRIEALPEDLKRPVQELLTEARRCYEEIWRIRLFYFLYGSTGGSERRDRDANWMRLEEIVAATSKEQVEVVLDEEDEYIRNQIGERYWRIYHEGDYAEREQVVNEASERFYHGVKEPWYGGN